MGMRGERHNKTAYPGKKHTTSVTWDVNTTMLRIVNVLFYSTFKIICIYNEDV